MRDRIGDAGLTTAISMAPLAAFPVVAWAAPVLPTGITAGSQSLARTTAEEAKAAAQGRADGLVAQLMTLNVDEWDVATTAGELGLRWTNTDAIGEAVSQYADSSLIKQYMIEKSLAATPVEVELETEVNSVKMRNFADTQCQGITAEPQDASVTRENGQLAITDSVPGRAVDAAGTETALNEALESGLDQPIKVTAQVTEGQPVITSEALATIQDMLGTYTTDFSNSDAAHSTNLAVGVARINGHVPMSGDVLSSYECPRPFTTANGYKTAAVYENGQVVDSIGGGVCQLAATLYNASLGAEVEIVRRQNHSVIIIYMKLSRDTAIAGTYKNIKIKSSYSTPIYMEGYISGRKLIFTIYGKETRPANRKVKYVSETLGSTNPGEPQLTIGNTLTPGARVRVRSSRIGLRSRLWRVVTVDDVEQEGILLNKDTYNASKAIYWVGPDLPVALPVVPDMTAPVDTAPTETAPVTDVEGGPGVAQPAPELTPAPEANLAPAVNPAPEANPASTANPVSAQGGPTVTPVEGP